MHFPQVFDLWQVEITYKRPVIQCPR